MSSVFEKVKATELSRFFMSQYNYREVDIKKVEGVFIENRLANYPLIRISQKKFEDIAQFNEDLAVMQRVIKEYCIISGIEDAKCLCLYFDGEVAAKVDNIYSIVIKDNDDIQQSDLLTSEFPQIKDKFNLDQVNNILGNVKNDDSRVAELSQEKKITEMFSPKEISKQTRFSRYCVFTFLILNLIGIYFFMDPTAFFYNFSFYDVFILQFDQYHRLLTGILLNNSFIYILCFAFIFFQYSVFVEMKLGTKKTMVLYGIGFVLILISMFFVGKGQVFLGSYPILVLVAGAYLGAVFSPEERDLLKFNMRNIFFVILVVVLFAFNQNTNLMGALVAGFVGFAGVFALGLKDKPIKKNFLYGFLVLAIFMVSLRFMPNQDLARNVAFERSYIAYIKYNNPIIGQDLQERLQNHYESKGAVDFE